MALNAAEVSPDGLLVAVALAEAGSDWQNIRLFEVATGEPLPDVLTWTKWVSPTWLPDSSGFLYWRYPPPDGGEFTDAMGAGELVLHRLGTGQDTDLQVWARPEEPEWMTTPEVRRRPVADPAHRSRNRLQGDRRGAPDRHRRAGPGMADGRGDHRGRRTHRCADRRLRRR